jgi:DNA-binding GntR family transcriptional regulator
MPQGRHRAISETLGREIASGAWPVGSRLPTETELQARFGASRHTVREALKTLSDQGLLRRRPKLGTFVLKDTPSAHYAHGVRDVRSLFEFAGDTALEVAYQGFVTGSDRLAETLGMPAEGRWLRIAGIRSLRERGEPLSWSEIYLPADYAVDRTALRGRQGPIYQMVLDTHGLKLDHVEQDIRAAALPAALAAQLRAEPDSPALFLRRRYIASTGATFEVSLNLYPADRYSVQSVIRQRA